jgi:hypothetical protein
MTDTEFARVRALVFEPYTLFRVRPMTGRTVNVAKHGYRLGSQIDRWPPDPAAANVFVFGGSTAFGYGIADHETIPSRLGEELADALPGKRPSVYNFATPNHVAVQERIHLEQLLLRGEAPGIAVFIDGFDEFIAPYYAPLMLRPFVHATAGEPGRQPFSRTMQQVIGRLLRRSGGGDPESSRCCLPDPRAVIDEYIVNTRLIRAVCREFAVRPLFVWQPVPCYRYDGEHLYGAGHGSAEALIDCVRAGYELMSARRGREFSGGDFLWLADMQDGRTENLYVDADHYTPEFSREVASRIARHLVAGDFMA